MLDNFKPSCICHAIQLALHFYPLSCRPLGGISLNLP